MVRVRSILGWLDQYAPFRYAASWDRCGLQVGDPEAPVERILVALDPSSKTIGEAQDRRCQCLVTHHPLIFHPIDAIRSDQFPGRLILMAASRGIHLVAAHTNLDAAREGTNSELARLLSLGVSEPLEAEECFRREDRYGGMGRIASLQEPLPLEAWVESIRQTLGCKGIRVVGDPKKSVHRVAICTGSGGSLIDRVIKAECDVYVTGDLKYHEAQRALEAGLALIDIGHFASERIVVQPLAEYLQSCGAKEQEGMEVLIARDEQDPFWVPGR